MLENMVALCEYIMILFGEVQRMRSNKWMIVDHVVVTFTHDFANIIMQGIPSRYANGSTR